MSGLSSLLVDETYNYTDNGNRSGSQTNSVGTKTYVNSTNNQTTADGRFTYTFDDEGNRSRKTDNGTGAYTEYAWDNRDRLVKVTEKTSLGATTRIVQEVYDAFDRWIGEKIDGNGDGDYLDSGDHARAFLYDGMKIVNQFDDGTQTHRYLQAMDMLFADEQLTGSAGTLWDLGDNLGSVRDVVNSSGTVVDHIVYDSYGRQVAATSGAPDRLFGFTGQPFDIFVSLQNNWHRWYDAEIGKWVSEDPIGFGGGDGNLVRYVGNQSVMQIDPSGLATFSVGGAVDATGLFIHSGGDLSFNIGVDFSKKPFFTYSGTLTDGWGWAGGLGCSAGVQGTVTTAEDVSMLDGDGFTAGSNTPAGSGGIVLGGKPGNPSYTGGYITPPVLSVGAIADGHAHTTKTCTLFSTVPAGGRQPVNWVWPWNKGASWNPADTMDLWYGFKVR